MTQHWIKNPKTDSLFILLPPIVVSILTLLFQNQCIKWGNHYNMLTWIVIIIGIDVAHVYATLFKTYCHSNNFKKNKKLLTLTPLFSLLISVLLFVFASRYFWSIMAYIAVFHFVKQQYGFMRLYARHEIKTPLAVVSDKIIIYAATLYPMSFWMMSNNRNFNWFVANEFIHYQNPALAQILKISYYIIITYYTLYIIYNYITKKQFNLPKNILIYSTILSWYLAIVHFNNDFIFTVLNVISHGIPYISLIYINEIASKTLSPKNIPALFQSKFIWFITFLLFLAFSEEFLWDILVWQEHLSISFNANALHFITVPLLTVPQLTHYILDGFIWKKNYAT
ncbi:hypothetical protein B0A58_15210 [Flavobacterium branchiophilum NBRC 15030 = ATCC 35035]|uniref:Uncharacterized protein n=1 Tax=Flavobacterium branchiophilum TaxID=55197 RepID=A0A543G4L7_9FLAO|nr:hypothetical protein [Flavobacterium branchiophilum]OXA69812.1 hypothetical protein B0A58_15210 [Flavobacterium branchiophilum NBRC 15030 = ATCC 35035]TQM41020.1 hypothetical protein BC670_1951 [Flavobacterium branchiophilum]